RGRRRSPGRRPHRGRDRPGRLRRRGAARRQRGRAGGPRPRPRDHRERRDDHAARRAGPAGRRSPRLESGSHRPGGTPRSLTMRRRTVLRLLSTALIPGALGRAAAHAADAAPRTAAPTRWIPPVDASSTAVAGASAPGVSAIDVRVGMSAAFKGTAAGLGTEFYRGAQAYYEEVNARGGVHGRTVTVVGLDDNYEPIPCVRNTIQLLEKEHVFFLSNYVGTPTLTRALPVIKRYADQQVLLVGNFTGAQPQ